MDKKNFIIATLGIAFITLSVEYSRLVHDFKLAHKLVEENKEVVKQARDIVTDTVFESIVDNFEE